MPADIQSLHHACVYITAIDYMQYGSLHAIDKLLSAGQGIIGKCVLVATVDENVLLHHAL